jgi:hypothetical protein
MYALKSCEAGIGCSNWRHAGLKDDATTGVRTHFDLIMATFLGVKCETMVFAP